MTARLATLTVAGPLASTSQRTDSSSLAANRSRRRAPTSSTNARASLSTVLTVSTSSVAVDETRQSPSSKTKRRPVDSSPTETRLPRCSTSCLAYGAARSDRTCAVGRSSRPPAGSEDERTSARTIHAVTHAGVRSGITLSADSGIRRKAHPASGRRVERPARRPDAPGRAIAGHTRTAAAVRTSIRWRCASGSRRKRM
jgi:hypothetical protein